jgi:hypothetical protein
MAAHKANLPLFGSQVEADGNIIRVQIARLSQARLQEYVAES